VNHAVHAKAMHDLPTPSQPTTYKVLPKLSPQSSWLLFDLVNTYRLGLPIDNTSFYKIGFLATLSNYGQFPRMLTALSVNLPAVAIASDPASKPVRITIVEHGSLQHWIPYASTLQNLKPEAQVPPTFIWLSWRTWLASFLLAHLGGNLPITRLGFIWVATGN
jgi:hypothetical protein